MMKWLNISSKIISPSVTSSEYFFSARDWVDLKNADTKAENKIAYQDNTD